ncbi:hypothetical protein LTSEMIS_3579, partial [Salmonella enterica subsp. enterica serovar Mississippi str. A4-633]
MPCSGGQWSDAAGKRALRLSAGGSHGSKRMRTRLRTV